MSCVEQNGNQGVHVLMNGAGGKAALSGCPCVYLQQHEDFCLYVHVHLNKLRQTKMLHNPSDVC